MKAIISHNNGTFWDASREIWTAHQALASVYTDGSYPLDIGGLDDSPGEYDNPSSGGWFVGAYYAKGANEPFATFLRVE